MEIWPTCLGSSPSTPTARSWEPATRRLRPGACSGTWASHCRRWAALPGDVLKMTVYLTDIADRATINPVRQEFFGETLPASTLVEVGALVIPDCCVEIEVIAAIGSSGDVADA